MKKYKLHSLLSVAVFTAAFFLFSIMPMNMTLANPAARLGDMTAHGGVITMGCATVLIGGMPAARVGDMHTCPIVQGYPPVPHVGGPILMGSPTVLIGGMPAARMGDMATCVGPVDSIAIGSPTVLIGVGGAGQAQTYSEEYILSRYKKSIVITKEEFELKSR